MDIQRKAFEESNNVNPDWSFKFNEVLQQYVVVDFEMTNQVDEFNEHWDTFRAGWDAKAQAVPEGFVLVNKGDYVELARTNRERQKVVARLTEEVKTLRDRKKYYKNKCKELPVPDDCVVVPKEPTDKTIAHMINTPIEVNLLCDHADTFLSEGEAYIAYKAMTEALESTND